MNTLVIYDSVFGNTEKIARAIADGIRDAGSEAELLHISAVTRELLTDRGLIVVGSPTRGFRPTKPVSEFIGVLPGRIFAGKRVASFDTRITEEEITAGPFFLKWMVKAFGYAATYISAALLKAGGSMPIHPMGFYVHGQQGPLLEGEEQRAREWGKSLVA